MYILKKQLPFIPNTPLYRSQKKTPSFWGGLSFGSFHRYRAKVFRTYVGAWFANLRFKGTIEKIHIQL